MLGLVGLPSSTYYAIQKRKKSPPCERATSVNRGGRPIPGYSLTVDGEKICNEQIKEYLCEAIAGDGFPYGYRKLTDELRETYNLVFLASLKCSVPEPNFYSTPDPVLAIDGRVFQSPTAPSKY